MSRRNTNVFPPSTTELQLNGTHFKITVVVDDRGFVNYNETNNKFDGYFIDVINALAKPERGNFTFDLLPPSGYGSLCNNNGDDDDDVDDNNSSENQQQSLVEKIVEPYNSKYRTHYPCGESDVTDLPRTNYTTDMYLGLFYITTQRQLLNQFTIPINPPVTGTLTMVGTGIWIDNIHDYVVQQQAQEQQQELQQQDTEFGGAVGGGSPPHHQQTTKLLSQRGLPACVIENTAYKLFLERTYPSIQLIEVTGSFESWNTALEEKLCDVLIVDHPLATSFVLSRYEQKSCTSHGKPIGIIGDSLGYGLNYYSIGIRNDIPKNVVSTLDYWLNYLMSCSPTDECPTESLSVLYKGKGGTGHECGYRNYPPINNNGLEPRIITGIVVGSVLLVAIASFVFYKIKLRRQENRYKKRFVQQIARNISIGPSPNTIPVDKLADEVQHIGNKEGVITKAELMKWILDVKLEFISDKDFDALWHAMDIDNNGVVNAIDFFVFLSACGDQFEKVYDEQQQMPKKERLKLAARRLSNINRLGEDGVRKLERKLERNGNTS